jgi:hypothetical protein
VRVFVATGPILDAYSIGEAKPAARSKRLTPEWIGLSWRVATVSLLMPTPKTAMYGRSNLSAQRCGVCTPRYFNGTAIVGSQCAAVVELGNRAAICKQPSQFTYNCCLQLRPMMLLDGQPIKHQSLDAQMDAHAFDPTDFTMRKPASLIGRSSFRNSLRAASKISGMVTLDERVPDGMLIVDLVKD